MRNVFHFFLNFFFFFCYLQHLQSKNLEQIHDDSKKKILAEIASYQPVSLQETENQDFFWDINLPNAISRIVEHCLNYPQKAKHLHDMVKIFNWPNFYSKDFSKKINENYYKQNYETDILIKLLALRQAAMILSIFLKQDKKIIRCDQIENTISGSSLHIDIAKFYNLSSGEELTINKRIIVFSSLFEILINSKTIKKNIYGVLSLAPYYPNITKGHQLSVITVYFELDKVQQSKPPNRDNVSNNGRKNFSTKEEALENYRVILEEMDKRYPLTTGNNGLIRFIIQQNNRGKTLSSQEILKQEKICIDAIEKEFFNGKRICKFPTIKELKAFLKP